MTEPLHGDHVDEVVEIVSREVRRFADLLTEELGRTPARADGNWNARDQYAAFVDAKKRYSDGEHAQ